MKTKLIALALMGSLSTAAYATEPDTQVVEYYHSGFKHYFITASATDARLVDSGAAGKEWVRTGRSFGAWSLRETAPIDAVMVHRFYSPGAISHFFSADENEVRGLREMEDRERASLVGTGKTVQGWTYEGEAFMALQPKNGVCLSGTETITRAYNNGGLSADDNSSNHRYVTDDGLKHSMEDRKWRVEGVVLCAPISSSSASNASSSTSSDNSSGVVASGMYSGTVQFKFEVLGKPEVKVRVPITLNLAANGGLTGSGGGCSFVGNAAKQGAGDNRLLGGSLAASGCSDARFNGNYGRLEIEQFGAKAIDIRFKQVDNAREATIEGVLNLAASTGAPTLNPTPNPTPSGNGGIVGDFAGMSTWIITERPSGQAERIVFNVNQNLALKISSAGVVTGAGQGCVFSGTVIPSINNRFTGIISASACTDARLNGSYQSEVHPEDGGALEVELERELEQGGLRTKVNIRGNLSGRASTTNPSPNPNPTPTPIPTPTGIAIAGSYAGNASFLATRRPAGGRETTEVNSTQSISLSVSGAGDVTGSGGGCSFSGKLAASNSALGVFAGSVTASGCTDAIVRGTYTATATREDANGIELELEREAEANGERVKVKIKARLSKQ
jgi:heat shock protein HslJ